MATKATLDELVRQINAGTLKAPSNTTAVRSGGRGSVPNKTTAAKSGTSGAAKSTAPTVRDSTGTLAKATGVPKKAVDTTSTAYYTQQRQSADRLYNMLASAAKERASAAPQVAGSVVEGAGRLNKALEDKRSKDLAAAEAESTRRYRAQLNSGKNEKGQPLTEEERFRLNTLIKRNEKMKTVREQGAEQTLSNTLKTADKAYQAADKLKASAEKSQAEAKKGLGKAGSFAVDLGTAGVQMLGDVALSTALPGAGLAAMGVRSGAGAAQTARKEGASYGQQVAYGLGSGALSVATEKLSSVAAPFKKVFGEGVLDKAITKAAGKLADSTAGKAALSFLSEGGEEVVEDLVQPILQQLTYKKGAMKEMLSTDFVAETLYDGLVGGTLGLVGSGVENLQARQRGLAAAETAPAAQTDVQQGTDTPQAQDAAQRAAEGAENAAPDAETAKSKGETVQVVENLRNHIRDLYETEPVASVSSRVIPMTEGRTMAEKARKLFESIKGVVTRPGFGDVDINGRSVKDDLSHGVGAAKAAVIPAIPNVIKNGKQIDFQQNWKGRPYDGYVFAAQITMDGNPAYVAAVVKRTSKNRFYLHEVIDAEGHVIKIDAGDRANPTSLATNGDAGTQSQASEGAPVTNADVGPAPTASVAETTPSGKNPLVTEYYDAGEISDPAHNARSVPPQGSSNLDTIIAQGAEVVKNGDGLGNADAGTVNTPFDRMQAKSDTFHPINENSARRVMNEQNIAPSEVPTVNPDTGRNIEKTVSTILNSPLTSPEMTSVYENAIAKGDFDYDIVTDQGAVDKAQIRIAREGWKAVADDFTYQVLLGRTMTKQDLADGINAYNAAVAAKDFETAFNVASSLTEAVHTSAQALQAANLINRLTPEGKLLTLRKIVDKMNRAQQRKPARTRGKADADLDAVRTEYVDNALGFTISDELATNYFMAETDAERAAAWDSIITDIAAQMPSTFREKADFWRYTSMLTNPTTHIRNMAGNLLQMGARKIKNAVGTALERAVIQDQSQRTKALTADKDLKAFARSQYDADQTAAMGGGKYSDATVAGIEREIQSKRKMFGGDDVLSKTIQGIGEKNNKLLDREDTMFNKGAYIDSFAQALKAKGVTAAEAQAGTRAADVEAARAYAIEEARRATYRNTTALSEAVSKMGRYQGDNPVLKAASFAADAFFPFRKTPANILTTGMDYSPLGILKATKQGLVDVKAGTCSAADVVDSLSAGLTGTGILALGAWLASEGLLHSRAGDDDKEEAFEKATGGQDYALQIGDKTYSLDWAVPAAMPLFAGASIMEAASRGGSTFEAMLDAVNGTSQVVLETSMLSSLNDLISNWSYADNKATYLIDKAASSYAGQYVPTAGSKIASAFDDTARKSYVEKGTGQVASDADYFLQGVKKKIPGVRNTLEPSVDLWGGEVSNGSVGERIVQSFLSPGYLKTRDNSAASEEVRRLAAATGDSGVYPQAAEKSFKLNGEDRVLTAKEYTQYAKTLGKTRKTLIEQAVKTPAYKGLSDTQKADVVGKIYQYANYTARMELEPGYEVDDWVLHARDAQKELGVSTADYLALYETYGGKLMSGKAYEKTQQAVDAGLSVAEYAKMKDSMDADGNGAVSQAEAKQYLARSGFSRQQKADLWTLINKSWKHNPYA